MFWRLIVAAVTSAICCSLHVQRRLVQRTVQLASGEHIPKGAKPTFDGTWRVPGEHPEQYVLEMDNGARAICRTFGGNVFSWITKDSIEVMGKRADADDVTKDSKPFAGGVPHCFPQFGPGAMMQHGFARGMKFIPEERAKKMSFDRMIFKLQATEETRRVFDHDFEYRFDVTLRDNSLEWDVIVINLGTKPFDVTLGLHTYLNVSSLKNVELSGAFSGVSTLDRNTGVTGTMGSDRLRIDKPTDLALRKFSGPVTVTDSGKGTRVTVSSKGFQDMVVWSPYGNEAMGYDRFVCVEPVQLDPVAIPPGKFKETKFYQKITCEKL